MKSRVLTVYIVSIAGGALSVKVYLKHEQKCEGKQRTASTYLTPPSKGPSAVADKEDEEEDEDEEYF